MEPEDGHGDQQARSEAGLDRGELVWIGAVIVVGFLVLLLRSLLHG